VILDVSGSMPDTVRPGPLSNPDAGDTQSASLHTCFGGLETRRVRFQD
jgi:hypothetical protein